MSANIFISFASQDIKVATTICRALESRGFECWISARNILPGENFQVAIVQAIRQAKIMLLVFTANSNNSQEITKELALASQQKLIVIPLRVEDVAPNDAFAYEFATRQWVDLFIDWEIAMDQLSQRIANALADRAPPAAEIPAPEPEPAPAPPAIEAAPPAPAPEIVAEVVEPEPVAAPEPIPEPAPVEPPASAALVPYVEPAAESVEGEASPAPKKKLGLVLAVAAAAVVAAGFAIPAMLKDKGPAAPAPEATLVAEQPPPPVATPVLPDPAAVVAEAPKPEAKPKKKAVKVAEDPSVDIPY